VQHVLDVFLARVKVKVGKLPAMTVLLDFTVPALPKKGKYVLLVLQGDTKKTKGRQHAYPAHLDTQMLLPVHQTALRA
jgi:hypothetical protein